MHNRKILLLTLHTFSLTGGIEKVCKILTKVLADGISSQKLKQENIKLFSLCDQTKDLDKAYFNTNGFKAFGYNKVKFGIAAVIQALKSDTIILSHINLLPIVFALRLFSKSKQIIMLAHGTEVWRNIKPWKKTLLQKHVDIWAVSDFTSIVLQKKHQIHEQRISILNNCLDPYLPSPKVFKKPAHLLKLYKLKENQPVILTISRLSSHEAYKGYDLIIGLMPKLLQQFPDLVYILAGSADLKEKNKLSKLIEKHQLQKSVLLAGFIPEKELVNHFLLADVFVMPSKKEGFGIVFIEATSCGCPVIAGNQDGSTDALLNGELGMLVNPESPEELIHAIQKTLSTAKTDEQCMALQTKCLENFSYDQYKDKVLKLLTN